jgi:hypothetical protein
MSGRRYNKAPKGDKYFTEQRKKERKERRIRDTREIAARVKATKEIIAPPPEEQKLIIERDSVILVPRSQGMAELSVATLSDIAAVLARRAIK